METGADPRASTKRWWRIGVALALVVGLLVVGHATGLDAKLSREHVRALVAQAGVWGVAVFVALFVGGELLHVPGMALVAAGVLVWGRFRGAIVAYLGALVAVSVCFLIVRAVGGRPLATVSHPRIRAILEHLDRRPVATVALVRTVLLLSPGVNYALALSSISFVDFFVGSAIGLVLPIAGGSMLFGIWLR